MLEPNFIPPSTTVARKETTKRLVIVEWFEQYIAQSLSGMLISGSLSYGQNYSVTPSSDIDMQLVITEANINQLRRTDCFDPDELNRALIGYELGYFKQFSLVFHKDNVSMECHFWDQNALIGALTFKNKTTPRLRSSTTTPSTDHAFSFDRQENTKDYYGDTVGGYAVADFPSYRRINGKLFLCRPITNILGLPLVRISNQELDDAIVNCWHTAANELLAANSGNMPNLKQLSIANTLPGKNKMSQAWLDQINQKTQLILEKVLIHN